MFRRKRLVTNEQREAELNEARLIIRWAAQSLSPMQRAAVTFEMFRDDYTYDEAGKSIGKSHGIIHYHKREAFRRMRAKLALLGIRSVSDVLSPVPVEHPISLRCDVTGPG